MTTARMPSDIPSNARAVVRVPLGMGSLRLRHALVTAAFSALYVAGPLAVLGVLSMPQPSVEERLLALGFEQEPAAVADLDRTVHLPTAFAAPEPPPVPDEPAPVPAEPAPVDAAPLPPLAVAVVEASPWGPLAAEGPPGDGSGAKATSGRGGSARTPRARRPRNCDKANPNIRAGTDGVVEIDRSLVERYTKDLESFMSLGYSRPYDEGDVHGWYIGGFGCTSPVAKAGFERGDVLLAVNGRKTRTWVGVYLLYQKLKNKDDFLVELVRDGEPVTLRFRVVPG